MSSWTKRLYTTIDVNKLGREKKLDYIFKTSINSKLNFLILNEIMNIFKKMNMVNSKDFIEYLPFILTSLKEMYILFYSDIKKSFKNNFLDVHDLAFFNRVEFLGQLSGENCTINCIQGFYSN